MGTRPAYLVVCKGRSIILYEFFLTFQMLYKCECGIVILIYLGDSLAGVQVGTPLSSFIVSALYTLHFVCLG